MNLNIRHYAFVVLTSFVNTALFSCSGDNFKVKGEIYGGEDQTIILEKSDFQGGWIAVDSTQINRNGGFSLSFPAPPSPDIFRLNLEGRFIYFPVEDKETITVNTSFDKFGREFDLAGSPTAEKLADFEKQLQQINYTSSDSLSNFKRKVFSNYLKDSRGSILSFYILTKTIDGKPLYNPTDPQDRKYFGAVATGFKQERPDDPHAALLEQAALIGIKEKNRLEGHYNEIEAEEISLIDMNLQDENGNYVKLSDTAGKGKPIVVIFSMLNLPESPEFNMELAKIYNRVKDNVVFYNVSIDEDQYAWREAAKNLPWITVYSPGSASSQDVLNYNVFQVPSFFIYNSEGELISRPLTLEQLNKSL